MYKIQRRSKGGTKKTNKMSFRKFMNSVMVGNLRKEIIGRDEWGDILIDTCFTNDTGKYETYIRTLKNAAVVEMYLNREESIKGHKKWVKKLKQNPNIEINNVISGIDWATGNY